MKLYEKCVCVVGIILLLMSMAIYTSMIIRFENRGKKYDPKEIELPEFPSDMYYDDKITYIMQTDQFQNGSKRYRIKIMAKLFDEFVQEGIVEEYQFGTFRTDMPLLQYRVSGEEFSRLIILVEFPKDQN